MQNVERTQFDAVVVGSGAGGGASAYVLAMGGARVLMLEAGRDYDPVTETPMFQLPSDAPLRGAGTPGKPFGFFDATVDGGFEVPGEPYRVRSKSSPAFAAGGGFDAEFVWWRARMLGGRTNHWGRMSLRMGPQDFRARSQDGLGADWPITYDELSPYYEKVERLIGVFGSNDGIENSPHSAPGTLLPPPKLRAYELLLKKTCTPLGLPVIPSHLAILTRSLDHRALGEALHPESPTAQAALVEAGKSRAACFYATACLRGCSIKAAFQSPTVFLPPARLTKNLDVVTQAMVREVTVNAQGKADGVVYIDKRTRKERRVKARVVILAASSLESVRILLNSRSRFFPQGLANGSGLLGKYLLDHATAGFIGAQIPALESLPPTNDDGAWMAHSYIPWWLQKEQKKGRLDFPRGYQIQYFGGRMMPDMNTFTGLETFTQGSFGAKFKEDCRRYFGSFVAFNPFGEMVANDDSYCELDPDVKDRWGIPVLRVRWGWSDHEVKQAAHQLKTLKDICDAMGGKLLDPPPPGKLDPGGAMMHEVGGARMGQSPKDSVLNSNAQAWDVPNLYVADGAPFPSISAKNVTLTIMALAWRTAEHALGELRKGSR